MFEEDMVDQKKEEEEALMVRTNEIKNLILSKRHALFNLTFLFFIGRKESVVDYPLQVGVLMARKRIHRRMRKQIKKFGTGAVKT